MVMKRLLLAAALAVATSTSSQQASAAPVAPAMPAAEPNAAGDIPDTQAFVTFTGRGYSVLVPEGWSRTQRGSAVTFTSNANSEAIDIRPASERYDVTARFHPVGQIVLRRHATLGTEPANLFTFRTQSKPDPVTGKRIELENELYSSIRNGVHATLLLSAPVGADNVDQWKKIAGSFRWK